MKTIKKLKSLKKPYNDTEIIVNRELRVWALKELAKLHWMELNTKKWKDIKTDNIFLENEKLVDLINNESLTPVETTKIHNLIVKDFKKLQSDIDKSKKSMNLSIKELEKTKTKSKNIACRLDKMFKPNDGNKISKKACTFCLKHKIKMAVWSTVMVLSWMAAFMPTQTVLSADTKQQNKSYNPTVYAKTVEKKAETNLLGNQIERISKISFDNLDKVDPKSNKFWETKELYLTFMKEINKKDVKDWNIILSSNELKSLLKMEYMYNIWVKKNIENNSYSKHWKLTDKSTRKIENINKQINTLKEAFNNFEKGDKLDLVYTKHSIDISVKTDKEIKVKWLDKFSY